MLADDIKQLIDRSVQANVDLLTRAGGVLREAARASKEPQRLQGKDARALLGDLVKLQLDYLKTLSDSSVQYLGSVVGLAESAVAPAARVPEATAQASALSGSVGQTAAFQFQIDNPNAQSVSAAIESREWLDRAGGTVPADSLVFDPAATVVEAGSARVVQGRVVVDERFRAGHVYDTVIRVSGFPGRQVALTLTVQGDAGAPVNEEKRPAAAPASVATAPRRRAAKKVVRKAATKR